MPSYKVTLSVEIDGESHEDAVSHFVDVLRYSAGNFRYKVQEVTNDPFSYYINPIMTVDASLLVD